MAGGGAGAYVVTVPGGGACGEWKVEFELGAVTVTIVGGTVTTEGETVTVTGGGVTVVADGLPVVVVGGFEVVAEIVVAGEVTLEVVGRVEVIRVPEIVTAPRGTEELSATRFHFLNETMGKTVTRRTCSAITIGEA